MRLVLAHGWGYGPSFWQPLCDALPAFDPLILDYGYRDGRVFDDPLLTDDQAWLAIGHSLGVARLLDWLMTTSKRLPRALISCCGFTRFCQAADFPQGIDRAVITAMRWRIKKGQLAKVLADFHADCGDHQPPPGPWDAGRLDTDLSYLAACDSRQALASLPCPVLALAARDDAIVAPSISEENFSTIIWSDYGGHNLPRARPLWCVAQIKNFIDHQGGI